MLRHEKMITRFGQWLDFVNLLLPPESGMPSPAEMSAADPVLKQLGEQFYKRFVPSRAPTAEEREAFRERLTARLSESFPGRRNGQRLKAEIEAAMARAQRRSLWSEFSSCFIYYGGDPPGSGPRMPEALPLYRLYYLARLTLERIAKAGRELQELPMGEFPEGRHAIDIPMPPVRTIGVAQDGHLYAGYPGDGLGAGVYDLFHDAFVPLLLSGAIDARLIRICGVCRTFFYAIRKDQLACNTMHRDVIRAQRFRENNPRYEQNRRQNAQAKSARKSGQKWLPELRKPHRRKE
jgi:hypothetical protein